MAIFYEDLPDVEYICKTEDQPISIEFKIGDGQIGASTVSVDKNFKKPPVLGTKTDIENKTAIAITTITDVNNQTNWTSVTITVREGTVTTPYGPYERKVDNDKDKVIYTLKIKFS